MADFLKPHLQIDDVVIIGKSSRERLRRAEQLTPGFVAQFRTLDIAPISEADTLGILIAVACELERGEEIRIEPSALEAAVELTDGFQPYRSQPGKSIVLVEQATSEINRQRGANSSSGAHSALTRRETINTFTRQTGLPEFIVADTTPLDLDAVCDHFADRIIGQNAAVDAMIDLIAIVKAGLNDQEKPLDAFMFIGPTGVGKTQLAKTLAQYLFGDEKRVVRFDVSEYNDPAGMRRLIGMPGSGSEGELTSRVRSQPFCVLLLDEFEKADAQIYDVFLQVIGEDRLTDASGQATSFQNAIIIMTSNLGASAREQRTIGLATDSEDRRLRTDASNSSNPSGPQPSSLIPGLYWQRQVAAKGISARCWPAESTILS
ncbi:MAG: AAA family ATPase [Chloroflexales bacterium]|nr:AAA family ATPase [Chloroflexales bacterium]